MELKRLGTDVTMEFDSAEEVAGLYAVLTGNPSVVSPEVFAKGQHIYGWLFEQITTMVGNMHTGKFEKELQDSRRRELQGPKAKRSRVR